MGKDVALDRWEGVLDRAHWSYRVMTKEALFQLGCTPDQFRNYVNRGTTWEVQDYDEATGDFLLRRLKKG